MSLEPDHALEKILQDLEIPQVSSSGVSAPSLTSTELELVATSLVDHSPGTKQDPSASGNQQRTRSLAFLVLAKVLNSNDSSSLNITGITTYLRTLFGESDHEPLIKALSLLSAIFQVEASVGFKVIQQDGIVDAVGDVMDLSQISTAKQGSSQARLTLALAELFSQSLNSVACRPVTRTLALDWLKKNSVKGATSDDAEDVTVLKQRTRLVCCVTLTKLMKASLVDPAAMDQRGSEAAGQGNQLEAQQDLNQLSDMFSKVLIGTVSTPQQPFDADSLSSTLEGLAYTSSQSSIKLELSRNTDFMKSLFDITRHLAEGFSTTAKDQAGRKTGLSASYELNVDKLSAASAIGGPSTDYNSLAFGIATILCNLYSRKPILTAEQQQVERLKNMANAGQKGKTMGETKTNSTNEEADSNQAVESRIKLALEQGLVSALIALAKTPSPAVKSLVGKIYLEVVTHQTNRLSMVRDGGFKSILSLIGSFKGKDVPQENLPTLQALAKMMITLAPPVLFGIDPASNCLDTIRPLLCLLTHPESTLLQKFESMMAMTNLASIDARVATRLTTIDDGQIMKQAEHLMLEDHQLVQRAAVELVCNLLASDQAFCRYSGDALESHDGSHTTATNAPSSSNTSIVYSRLHILLAMTNVYDRPTRLAAAGALATLTQSPSTCGILLETKERREKVLSMVDDMLAPPLVRDNDDDNDGQGEDDVEEISTLDPDPDLVHRAVVMLVSLLAYMSTKLDPVATRDEAFGTADKVGIPQRLLLLLATWTSPECTIRPDKEVVDATIECLRIFKSVGVKLVVE